jgi:hypothetical protein
MFDCPIPLPTSTHYDTLGVRPEATAEELRDAMTELSAALRALKKAVVDELEAVRTAVPGLREAAEELKKLQGESGSDPKKVSEAGQNLSRLELQAVAINPRYRDLCNRERELGEEELRVNQMALQNPSARQDYDKSNPPFELLKLADCARDELDDPRFAAARLREELVAFLTARKEPVFHPSDLTRSDFSGDFTHNPILDGPG